MSHKKTIQKILVANRGEIAIRIFRALSEMNIRTVGIYSHEDRYSLFRYKADEAYELDKSKGPVGAYLDIDRILELARQNGVDAIHPGYGFLSENVLFARRVKDAGLLWVGPSPDSMETLGDKISARKQAIKNGIPVIPGSEGALENFQELKKIAHNIGFPLMLKAAGGGGGRGMAVIRHENELEEEWERCRRESQKAFHSNVLFVERYVENPQHIEVQILGDTHGNIVHLFERDCSVQRRFQKVVEMAPCRFLDEKLKNNLYRDALTLARSVAYENAGTFEFLVETQGEHLGKYYFIEANPRLQVEHTVTEWITGIDLVRSQIRIAAGESLDELGLGKQENIQAHGFSIQCRINAEDPSNAFAPQTGRISTWRSAAGMGVRLDSGGGDANFEIGADYDSLLCKVSTWSLSFEGALTKMQRALGEFRIRGVRTNIPFLQNVMAHEVFQKKKINTSFIDTHHELFHFPPRLDRANKILYYLGHTTLHRTKAPQKYPEAHLPKICPQKTSLSFEGSKKRFEMQGKQNFLENTRQEKRLLLTDTSFRDAHQSLFATRLRSRDMLPIAPYFNTFDFWSLEVWGGATYDVAYRFLKECPWKRLECLREKMPHVLLQMLLRGSNVLGYKNQPDNLIRHFVREARKSGIDVFRIFDAFNYLPNLEVAFEAAAESGALVEGTICYTGNVADTTRQKYPLSYYVDLAGGLKEMGADLIAIKDMAGLLTPAAAKKLIPAIRDAVDCPVHLHMHDTASFGGATLLAAADAGVDIVDVAMGPVSSLTSQPNLGTLVANLENTSRDTGFNSQGLREIEYYWQSIREKYSEFESGLKSGSASVYWHEIPGGQYSNLLPQARALGLEDRWPEVLKAFHEANEVLGQPIKVTPTSKAVGDLALAMVSQKKSGDDLRNNLQDFNWPASVRDMFKGLMGQPPYPFDKNIQKAVLGDEAPYRDRAGKYLEDVNFEYLKTEVNELLGRQPTLKDLLTHVLFPDAFHDYVKHVHRFGDTSILDTDLFFHGLEIGKEVQVEIEHGKTLIIKLLVIGEADERGERPFHFELNGFPRTLMIRDLRIKDEIIQARQADPKRDNEIGAPMPGKLSALKVGLGDRVKPGQALFVIEAMKMETIVTAKIEGTVKEITFEEGQKINKNDLVILLKS
jgi:pyruvate carboxylase